MNANMFPFYYLSNFSAVAYCGYPNIVIKMPQDQQTTLVTGQEKNIQVPTNKKTTTEIWGLRRWLSIHYLSKYADLFKHLLYQDLFNIRDHHLFSIGVPVIDTINILKCLDFLRQAEICFTKIKLRIRNGGDLHLTMIVLSQLLLDNNNFLVGNLGTQFVELLALVGERLEIIKPRSKYYECQIQFFELCLYCERRCSFMPRELRVVQKWRNEMKPIPHRRVLKLMKRN